MATKPTELQKLQAEYNKARQRYLAVAPLDGRRASYWRRRFSDAAVGATMGHRHNPGDLMYVP